MTTTTKTNTIPGYFVSVWESGSIIKTVASLDLDTLHVDTEEVDANDDCCDSLKDEYFEPSNGESQMKICPHCHEYALKSVGDGIHEEWVCPDHCEEEN